MKSKGFTLVELLVAMVVSTVLISVTVSVYSAFRKNLSADQARAAYSQNARVALDRLSREVRQAPIIVTEFPEDESDMSVAQSHAIEFEDGHADNLTYRKYYISGSILKMDTVEYYFSAQSSVRVEWNATRQGQSPSRRVISTQDIAESIQDISFYGSKPLRVIIEAGTSAQSVELRTSLYERNL